LGCEFHLSLFGTFKLGQGATDYRVMMKGTPKRLNSPTAPERGTLGGIASAGLGDFWQFLQRQMRLNWKTWGGLHLGNI
jgi:hypothetical protein